MCWTAHKCSPVTSQSLVSGFQWGLWLGHSQSLMGVPCNHRTLRLSGDPCPGNLEGERSAGWLLW